MRRKDLHNAAGGEKVKLSKRRRDFDEETADLEVKKAKTKVFLHMYDPLPPSLPPSLPPPPPPPPPQPADETR